LEEKEVDVCPEETVAGSWFNSRLCVCVCVCVCEKEVRNSKPVITLIIIQREPIKSQGHGTRPHAMADCRSGAEEFDKWS